MQTVRAEEAIEIPEDALIDPGPGRILVRVASSREGKYGSLILPSFEGKAQFYGRVERIAGVMEADPDAELSMSWLEVGDLVIFGKYSGTQLTVNRDTFIICRETDVLARIRDKAKE